jgi:hypothetical protein
MTSAWLTNNEFPSPEEFSPRILRPTGDVLSDERKVLILKFKGDSRWISSGFYFLFSLSL